MVLVVGVCLRQYQDCGFTPEGWCRDASKDQKLIERLHVGSQRLCAYGIVEDRIPLFYVGASAWGTVFSCGEDQCLRGDARRLDRSTSGCTGKAAYQGNMSSCLCREGLQVLAKRKTAIKLDS